MGSLTVLAVMFSFLFVGMALQVASGPLTDRLRPYDLMRWEPDFRYTRDAQTIKNNAGVTIAAGAIVCGLPLKKVGAQYQVVNSTDEANATAIFLGDDAQNIPESLANAAITAAKYPILVRGPAIINQSVLPANDLAGAAYTIATLVTAYAALSPPVLTMKETTGGIQTQSN